MKVDMSPEAVTRRLRKVGELVRACRALSRRREDQLQFTDEFKGQIAQSENEMKAGKRPRVRRPDRP
jgi:hypothetical protein